MLDSLFFRMDYLYSITSSMSYSRCRNAGLRPMSDGTEELIDEWRSVGGCGAELFYILANCHKSVMNAA